jgi:hypothetical protein
MSSSPDLAASVAAADSAGFADVNGPAPSAARRYIMIDDKLRILTKVKEIWGTQVTTVLPKQGQYANDFKILASYPAADMELEDIGDLLNCDYAAFLK